MLLLSPANVARRLSLSTSRVIQLDREGALPALRDSAGRRFYDAEAVERFAREREARRAAQRSPSPKGAEA
jgi:DNA-binding transcriptional MerR regulator